MNKNNAADNKRLTDLKNQIAKKTQQKKEATDAATIGQLTMDISLAELELADLTKIVAANTTEVQNLTKEFRVRKEQQAFQTQIDELNAQINTFNSGAQTAIDRIDELTEQMWKIPEEAKYQADRDEIQAAIDYSATQAEKLYAKAEGLQSKLDDLEKSRKRKEDEAAAQAQQLANEKRYKATQTALAAAEEGLA